MIGILGVLALALPIAAVVWLLRRLRHSTADDGSWSLRRAIQYAFLLAALFSAASGVTRLATAALPAGRIAGPGASEVALGLSLTIVAVPLWLVLWQAARRRLTRDGPERSSSAWALYVVAATTIPLIVAVVNLFAVGRWALAVDDFPAQALAAGVVWGAVWGLHTWIIERSELTPSNPLCQLAALAGSAVGLVALAVGAIGVVSFGLGQMYHAVAGPALIEAATTEAVRRSVAVIVPGVVVWWWYWLRQAAHGPPAPAWDAYVLAIGVFGGLVTAVTAAAVALYAALQWIIGEPDTTRAAIHFSTTPEAVAAALVGLWVWAYHALVLRHAPRERGEPDRVYAHVMAAVGLGTATAGATVALVFAIDVLAPAPLAAGGRSRNTLALAVTLLVVGVPLWTMHWRRLQRRVRSGALDELRSPARRIFCWRCSASPA